MVETINGVARAAEHAQNAGDKAFEKIMAAAQPGAVFSSPIVCGQYTIITANSVFAVGGFGSGSGPKSEGGSGGGGASYARPLAAIIIGPEGVKVQPIVDATRIALAVLTAWAGVALAGIRFARASGRLKRT